MLDSLQKKRIPSNMAANRIHTTFLKNQSAIKCMFPLNAFPLKFRAYDNFYVLWLFLASARFQVIV